jgi:hypothetical protein
VDVVCVRAGVILMCSCCVWVGVKAEGGVTGTSVADAGCGTGGDMLSVVLPDWYLGVHQHCCVRVELNGFWWWCLIVMQGSCWSAVLCICGRAAWTLQEERGRTLCMGVSETFARVPVLCWLCCYGLVMCADKTNI